MYKAFFINPKHLSLTSEIKFINNKNKPIKVAVGLYNSKKPICSNDSLFDEEQYMYRKREHGYEVPILEDDHEYSYIFILYEDNMVQIARFGSTNINSPFNYEDILNYYDDKDGMINYFEFIDSDFTYKDLIIDKFENCTITNNIFKNEKFIQLLLDLDINICKLCNEHYTKKKCSGCKKKICKYCGKNINYVRDKYYFSCNDECAKKAHNKRRLYKKE